MGRPETPLSTDAHSYAQAFTRWILATKSTATDDERAAADAARMDALGDLLFGAAVDPTAPGRRGPRPAHGRSLRHSPRKANLGRRRAA